MDTLSQAQPEGLGRKDIQRVLQRYAQIGRQRLQRIHASLTREQDAFFTLLPLLLHVNHPALPGFVGSDAPAGIAGYVPDRDSILLARRHARSLKKEQRPQRRPPLLGLYLIGSSGTLGQDRHSDFDFWLCHHRDLQPPQLQALQQKTQLLQAHAAGLGLHIHFFNMHAEAFRDGQHTRLSNESSGNTQHHLLLEEFYRSGLLLAGRPPLWWLVPPQQVDNYRDYCAQLIEKRFVREQDWLDFGGLHEISADEFFSAAHWQLFKSIELPYKALLKLMLFESYATQYPNVGWLSNDVKCLIHSDRPLDADAVDAYMLMMQRIEQYLQHDDPQRLALARRAFYFKSGVRLSQRHNDDWKHARMQQLCERWGWDRGELLNLDSHTHWKLGQVLEERNQLVAELSRSYRLLTELARRNNSEVGAGSNEMSLLGRKLYAALERRPGKLDQVNPAISDDLSEEVVWLRRSAGGDAWQLFLQPPQTDSTPPKTTRSLVEMLAWLQRNGVIGRHTRIDLPAAERGPVSDEYLRILKVLHKVLPPGPERHIPLGNFSTPAQGQLSIAFVNSLHDPLPKDDPHRRVSLRGDALSFGAARLNLVQRIEHLHSNSWGELQVDHYQDEEGVLDLLCAHLDLFWQNREPGQLQCHCHTPAYGGAINARLTRLATDQLNHFRHFGEQARYLLCIADQFHLIEVRRRQFTHSPVGGQLELLELLGEADDRFRPTLLDEAAIPNSPLAFVLRANRPQLVQVLYQVQRSGIDMFVLDDSGALHQQWLANAEERHFLIQQQRFFDTVRAWRSQPGSGGSELVFGRLKQVDGEWQVETVLPPHHAAGAHTELILSTGRRGPWRDGFSLISGTREFNSLSLGAELYNTVADYLLGLRKPGTSYPIYLTGVVVADEALGMPMPLAELLRFKNRVENRLADAVSRRQAYT